MQRVQRDGRVMVSHLLKEALLRYRFTRSGLFHSLKAGMSNTMKKYRNVVGRSFYKTIKHTSRITANRGKVLRIHTIRIPLRL